VPTNKSNKNSNKDSGLKQLLNDDEDKITTWFNDFAKLHKTEVTTMKKELEKLDNKKKELLKTKKVLDITTIPDTIILNVGGMKFQTTKEILQKVRGSYFNLMLSGEIDIQPIANKQDTYFIDRDGTHFKYILDFIKDGSEKFNSIPSTIIKEVHKEMLFYQLNPPTITPLSVIINNDTFKTIENWLGAKSTNLDRFNLLYRASVDSFSAKIFHEKCDQKGPTITIVQTTDGYVFGGYSSQSWDSDNRFSQPSTSDSHYFIFTLLNPYHIPPTKYIPIYSDYHYSYSIRGYGPVFGRTNSYDFYITSSGKECCQNFPSSFFDTTGKGKTTLTPHPKFTVKDYEVYEVRIDY